MKYNMDILSPAGSMQALIAALKSGADCVYFGGESFNAREAAKNFSDEELKDAIELCHLYGAKAYVTVNTLASDRELEAIAPFIENLCKLNVDAVIVQDLGLAKLIKEWAPQLKMIASTQCAFNSKRAVESAAKLGFWATVVGRELSLSDIEYICKNSPIDIEAFAHGAMCFSMSGQCYMSALLGRRSANRGRCAGPCRLPYSVNGGKSRHMLSLKDMCTLNEVSDLARAGVKTVKIEGRLKRPEYVSSVTSAYKKALKTGLKAPKSDIEFLSSIFSRQGFTKDYLMGESGRDMFGMRDETYTDRAKRALNAEKARIDEIPLLEKNRQDTPVNFEIFIERDKPTKLIAKAGEVVATAVGATPEIARNRAVSFEDVEKALSKLGDTRFYLGEISASIGEGLMIAQSALNALRRDVTELLDSLYKDEDKSIAFSLTKRCPEHVKAKKTELYGTFTHVGQIPENASNLSRIFIGIEEFSQRQNEIKALVGEGLKIGVILPKIFFDKEEKVLTPMLKQAKEIGACCGLVYNVAGISLAKEYFDEVIGDVGLNVYNSYSIEALKELGADMLTLSQELSYAKIADLKMSVPCGILAYGRQPLMLSQNCLYKNEFTCNSKCKLPATLTDRQGEDFIVMRDAPFCRNTVLNAKTLYVADKKEEYENLPLSFLTLSFTTEDKIEAAKVIDAYMGFESAKPADFTRGLYTRGVM